MYQIDKNIEYYRKLSGLSRKDLAEGICDVSTLYRIEKGMQNPRLDLLYEICKKLNVPMDFIMNDLNYEHIKIIENYKNLCREFTYNEDYENLVLTLEKFEDLISVIQPQMDVKDTMRFITWHKAIILHLKEKKPIKAEEQLISIHNESLHSELDIGISNSLGIVKLNTGDYLEAYPYFKNAHKAMSKLPFIKDPTLAPRVTYNLAYCYYHNGNLTKAHILATSILEMLKMNQLSYIMGQTKHLLAMIYKRKNDYLKAKEYLTEAIYVFQIEHKEANYQMTRQALQEIEILIKKT